MSAQSYPELAKSSNAAGASSEKDVIGGESESPKSEAFSKDRRQSTALPEGEEDSAPSAQPQSERTKDTTRQA